MTDTNSVRTILFVGRPGSGKETQARLLSEKTGFPLLSTGQRFRELREHRNELGKRVKEAYDTGRLLPHWFAEFLFEETLLNLAPNAGIIFEGTGRAIAEAQRFDEVARWLGRAYCVINLEVSEQESSRRQLARAQMSDRPESNTTEKVQIRFDEFNRSTIPALEFFRGKGFVIDINGEQPVAAIHAEVLAKLNLS